MSAIDMLIRCAAGQQDRTNPFPIMRLCSDGCGELIRVAYTRCPACVLKRDTRLHTVLDTKLREG